MEITLEEIKNKFEKLPEDLRWAIIASNIDENITSIGQKHGLNIEELGQLSLETHMVVLGYTHPDKLEESIKNSLGFPNEKNKELVREINEKILKDIREKLMSLNKKEDKYIEQIEEVEKTRPHVAVQVKIENTQNEEVKKEMKIPEKINYEDAEKEAQNKKIIESVFFKKLSDSFKAPTTKTEHFVKNISKDGEKNETSASQHVKIPTGATIKTVDSDTQSISPSFSIKEDPYRITPE
jgi:hypothetical protein